MDYRYSMKLLGGKKIIQIAYAKIIKGNSCYYVYEHQLNYISSIIRIIEAEFIKKLPNGEILIKREDCKNNSKVPSERVYVKNEAIKKME